MACSAKHKVPDCTTSKAAAFFYALTNEFCALLATCFQVCWVGFGLSSGVFYQTTLFFIRYCLHLKVVMKNKLYITFFWQKIMRSEDHILCQSSRYSQCLKDKTQFSNPTQQINCIMHKMDGDEALRQIRQFNKDVVIIA